MEECVMIEDLRKFDRMTRPVKFRRWKMLKQGDLRPVIKYWFYNLLTKLHILKRYVYRDSGEGTFFEPDFKPRTIESNNYVATVRCKLNSLTFIEQDYFYRTLKDGSKKILYVLADESREEKVMTCYLDNVGVKFNDTVYFKDNMPVFRSFINEDLKDNDEVHYVRKTFVFDLTKIESMRRKVLLSTFNPDEVTFMYMQCSIDMMHHMDDIELADITEIKG
jgi:hypothetical protein